jgi:hypothetical protein
MKTIIQVILVIGILALGFLVWKSVQDPIDFNKEKEKRFNSVIQNLKDIRTAQLAYKRVHGEFTSSFDTLINFVKTDSMPIVKSIGHIPDSLVYVHGLKKAEKIALEDGTIIRDTMKVSTLDSLFSHDYPIEKLRYVPYTNKEEFILGATEIETGSKVKVKVFEAKVPYHVILNGLDEQQIINLMEEAEALEKYRGLKVGSLKEATNHAGNWE